MTPVDRPNELRLNDGSMEGAEFWDFGWFIHRHKAKSDILHVQVYIVFYLAFLI
jgi:phage gp29-like protein